MRRILLVNPNTSASVTRRLADVAQPWLPEDCTLEVTMAAQGPAYIGSPEAMAQAEPAAVQAVAQAMERAAAPFDAVIVGCFADLAVRALRARFGLPAVSLLGASMARAVGQRLAIVTAGAAWRELLPPMLAPYLCGALGSQLVGVRTFEASLPEIEADPAAVRRRLLPCVQACIDEDGAQCVIVAGAGLAGLWPAGLNAGATVVDCVRAAVDWAAGHRAALQEVPA